MKVVQENKNVLLKRTEVVVEYPNSSTPLTRAQVKTEIAKHFKVEEDVVIVSQLKTHFGSRDVVVSANVYETKEALEKATPKHIQKRNAAPEVAAEE